MVAGPASWGGAPASPRPKQPAGRPQGCVLRALPCPGPGGRGSSAPGEGAFAGHADPVTGLAPPDHGAAVVVAPHLVPARVHADEPGDGLALLHGDGPLPAAHQDLRGPVRLGDAGRGHLEVHDHLATGLALGPERADRDGPARLRQVDALLHRRDSGQAAGHDDADHLPDVVDADDVGRAGGALDDGAVAQPLVGDGGLLGLEPPVGDGEGVAEDGLAACLERLLELQGRRGDDAGGGRFGSWA